MHTLVFLETILQDVRFAARIFTVRPLFTLLAIATLALGIGANTAVFTIVRSVLLRPLPFPDGDGLFVISTAPAGMPFWLYPGTPDSDYLALRERNRSFESIATFGTAPATLTGAGDAVRLARATVTPDFFRVLGVVPSAGRDFSAGEGRRGDDRVVLVSNSLW